VLMLVYSRHLVHNYDIYACMHIHAWVRCISLPPFSLHRFSVKDGEVEGKSVVAVSELPVFSKMR